MTQSPILIIQTLLEPFYLIILSISFLPRTILNIILAGDLNTLSSWPAFQNRWFATQWAVLGPRFSEFTKPTVAPVVARARGVVLDIGPGSGNWVSLFSKPVQAGAITKIYGVEPNLDQHKVLRQKVKAAGLDDVYEIIGAGAESIPSLVPALGQQSVDTVVTLQVLCSAPHPEDIVRELYGYLKPGGEWIMHEHIQTHEGGFLARYQVVLDTFWGYFYGGCSLTRPTDKLIQETGQWNEIRLARPEGFNAWMTIPHIGGYLVKSRA